MRRASALILPLALILAAAAVIWRSRAPDGAKPPGHDRGRPTTDGSAPRDLTVSDPLPPPPVEPGRAGSLTVFVGDGTSPVAGARVMVLNDRTHESFDGATNASGEHAFDGLRAGEWRVGARHPRFVFAEARAQIVAGQKAAVALTLGQGGRAAGTVTNAAGQPLAGATVVILDPEKRVELSPYLSARANEQGQYVLEGIPLNQTLGLGARAARYRPLERYNIVFTAPGEEQLHHFALETGTFISGRVVDDTRAPVAGATVTAGALGDLGGSARTDKDGQFAIYGLGDRPVALSASARGYGTSYVRNVAPNTQGLDIQVFRGGRIRGRVTPAVETFSVLLHRYETDLGRELLVRTAHVESRAGEFVIADVARGAYELAIDANGYETVARVKVSVNAGETVDGVTIEIRPKP